MIIVIQPSRLMFSASSSALNKISHFFSFKKEYTVVIPGTDTFRILPIYYSFLTSRTKLLQSPTNSDFSPANYQPKLHQLLFGFVTVFMGTSDANGKSSSSSLVKDFLHKCGGVAVIDGGFATELERHGADLNDPLWSAKCLFTDPHLVRDVCFFNPTISLYTLLLLS